MHNSSHTLLRKSSQQLGDVTESILSTLAKRDIEKERIEKLIWFTKDNCLSHK